MQVIKKKNSLAKTNLEKAEPESNLKEADAEPVRRLIRLNVMSVTYACIYRVLCHAVEQ